MSKKVRVLSLDGGGTRGVIPATILVYVEEQLKKKSGNSNARLADYFDFVAGTSTGGMLACFYLAPGFSDDQGKTPPAKFEATQALDFYVQRGNDIFNKSRKNNWFGLRSLVNATKFNPIMLDNVLLEVFGNTRMTELIRPCLVTTYNMKTTSPFFFNSQEGDDKQRDFYVRDVARSTSAAPTYFPPAQINNLITGEKMCNIDGGLFAHDPTMMAYVECRKTKFPQKEHPTAKDMLILSLGTGASDIQLKQLDKSNRWWLGKWATYLPQIVIDGAFDTITTQMRWLFDTLEGGQKNYLRVDVLKGDSGDFSPDLADASPENINKLQEVAQATLEYHRKSLDEFIDQLMA
ncbi:patatin-like phospholipase family protein [uncultured Microscilla sp.]|uniref:patatin-like phospholipase family protein n=1 Tax=uncultured Microscilla sp. TaxID=432653 RepID=UPI002604CC93|nr:patatin-like phospholipase family protein [uncultured Microscilla sp.]